MIETSLLQTLVAVGRNETFSKAAEILNVTQSAVSQNVKNLESKVGVKLFVRMGRKYSLTNEGKKLYDLACEMLARMNSTLQDIKESQDRMSGPIRIGTFSGVGKSWLGPLLVNYSLENPEVKVALSLDISENLVSKFEKFELDCMVVPEELIPRQCNSDFLYEEKAILVFPDMPGYDIHNDLTLDQLLEYPLIFFDQEAPLFKKWCIEKFNKVPKNCNTRFIINSHGNVLYAVSAGLGVAVVPNHVLRRSFYKERVKTLGDDFVVPINRLYFVYRQEAMDLLRMRRLREVLLDHILPFNGN